MPNKNYIKGRRKEYKVCKQLKEDGFDIAQRSAGSHSPVDVFAVSRSKKIIKFIQCKPDNFPKSKQNKILNEMGWLDGNFRVVFEVV